MKQVKLHTETLNNEFPPDNTTVFFKGWLTRKDCVWTIGRRWKPKGEKKIQWQDYSMGIMLEDEEVVEWSLIPEQ